MTEKWSISEIGGQYWPLVGQLGNDTGLLIRGGTASSRAGTGSACGGGGAQRGGGSSPGTGECS